MNGAIYYHLVDGKLMRVQSVLEDGDRTYVAEGPALVPGQGCPMCGKPVAKSQAQRPREWRARKLREAEP